MRVIRSKDFTATRAWEADDIANMDGTTVRLHWTDQPNKWHVNDGEEVFAGVGCGHVAHPCGEARILVIEREGSV